MRGAYSISPRWATISVSKWTQRHRTILSFATKPLRRNLRRCAIKWAVVVLLLLSSPFFISWPTHYVGCATHRKPPRTFQVQMDNICADKFDDAIPGRL